MSTRKDDSSRSLDRSIQEVTYTPDFESIFRREPSKDMAGGSTNNSSVPHYHANSQPPQHRDITASPITGLSTYSNTTTTQQCFNSQIALDPLNRSSQPQQANFIDYQQQQRQSPQITQTTSPYFPNDFSSYQQQQAQLLQSQQHQQQQIPTNHVHASQNNVVFLTSDNQRYATHNHNLQNNQVNQFVTNEAFRGTSQPNSQPLSSQQQIGAQAPNVTSMPPRTYHFYANNIGPTIVTRPRSNPAVQYSRLAPTNDQIQPTITANQLSSPASGTPNRSQVHQSVPSRLPLYQIVPPTNTSSSPQPRHHRLQPLPTQFQPQQFAPRFANPQSNVPQQQQQSQQQQYQQIHQGYQQQQAPTIQQQSPLAGLLSSTPCSNRVLCSSAQNTNHNRADSNTDSSHYGGSTDQQTTPRSRTANRSKQITNQQQQNQPVLFEQEHALEIANGGHPNQSAQPAQPPQTNPQPATNGLNNSRQLVLEANSRIPVQAARLHSVQVQTTPDYQNKACQFDGMVPRMVNRSMNATVTMVDSSAQTEDSHLPEKSEKVGKTYEDRASSPINFPPTDVPVRRKVTAKRRKVETKQSDSGSDTDINVLE